MITNNKETFNGNDTSGNYITTTNWYPSIINDPITYCPYCGKKLPEPTNDIHYCPYCGKTIPRTTTTPMIIYHWNAPNGTVTYPRDGIINPQVIC